jgi:hypothetical protein
VFWTLFRAAAASRRDLTIVAWHEVPGRRAARYPSRRVGRDRALPRRVRWIGICIHPVGMVHRHHETWLAARLSRILCRHLSGPETVYYMEQQLEYHRTRAFRERYLEVARMRLRRKIPVGKQNQSRRTLRDGFSWDTFSRHFVPGYRSSVPTGRVAPMQNVQTPGIALRAMDCH